MECNDCPNRDKCILPEAELYLDEHKKEIEDIMQQHNYLPVELVVNLCSAHPLISAIALSQDKVLAEISGTLGLAFRIGFYFGRTMKQTEIPKVFVEE